MSSLLLLLLLGRGKDLIDGVDETVRPGLVRADLIDGLFDIRKRGHDRRRDRSVRRT